MVGNIPNFTKIDVLRCFLRLDNNRSRQRLAKELELGEGTVRTILKALKSKKLLNSTKRGHFLSKKGYELMAIICKVIDAPKIVTLQDIYPEFKKTGVLVKDASSLKEIYRFRDIAVKNGAEGALILRFTSRLFAPESDYEYDYKEIEKQFRLHENDVLILSFSKNNRSAENGALAAAIELSNSLKKFINEF